jgi:hypothetical protein
LNLFDNYNLKKGAHFDALKQLAKRIGAALPLAILTGAMCGALIPLLLNFLIPDYAYTFGPLTCVGPMTESKTTLAIVGMIYGGIVNIILSGVVAGIASEPLPKKAMMVTGAVAGLLSWFYSIIVSRL